MSKTTAAELSRSRSPLFNQNEALLMQFLLHETLKTTQTLKNKASKPLLEQVVGDLQGTQTAWNTPYGHLPKLGYYFTLLQKHEEPALAPLHRRLEHVLEKALGSARRCLNEIEKTSSLPTYAVLRGELRVLLKLLFEKLPPFRENVSLLIFLLKYQKEFDAFFLKPMIKTLFIDFFPQGELEARRFLKERMQTKGFDHLFPGVAAQLNALGMPK